MKKRILSVLLALSMTAALLAPAAAAGPGELTYSGSYRVDTISTSGEPGISLFSASNGEVALKSGNYDSWYAQLDPDGQTYIDMADTLFSVLAEAVDNDGTADYLIGDAYFNELSLNPITTETNFDSLSAGSFVNAAFDYGDRGKDQFNGIYLGSVPGDEYNYATNLITAVYNAFDRDYPEVFWLSGGSMPYALTAGSGENSTSYLFFVLKGVSSTVEDSSLPGFTVLQEGYTEETIKDKIAARDQAAGALVASVAGMSDYQKVAEFNDWLTKHNEYNTSPNLDSGSVNTEAWECVSALAGRTGENGPVCEGYARAFKVLCDRAGVPCVLVSGQAKSDPNAQTSGPHMWNYAKVDNVWYAVDVTWNDPTGGNAGAVSGGEGADWLLVGSDTQAGGLKFGESHAVTNKVSSSLNGVSFTNGPVLSAKEYEPGKQDLTARNFTVTPTEATYDGTPHSVTVTPVKPAIGETYSGTVTVSYRPRNGAASETAPTDAGTYTILIDAEADSNWNAAAGLEVGTLTIAKAEAAITVPAALGVTVGGSKALGATLSPAGGVLTYRSSNESVATVDAAGNVTGVAEGSAVITVSFAGDDNCSGDTKTVAVTVTDKEPVTVAFADAASVTYSGSPFPLGSQFSDASADPTQPDGAITYQYDGREYASLSELPSVTDAGTYTVTAVYDSATHHGEKSAAFTINKAAQTALTVTASPTMKFKGTQTLSTEGGSGAGAVTYAVTPSGAASIEGSVLTAAKVGSVTVTATKAGDNNYEPATSAPVAIEIGKADAPAGVSVSRDVQWSLQQAEISLTGGPEDQGSVTYGAITVTDLDGIVDGTPTASEGSLTVTLVAGLTVEDVDKTASITVPVVSENYETYNIVVTITLVDKLPQAPLSITSTAVTFPNTLRLTVSGGTTNGAVTYVVTNGSGEATVSGNVLTPVKAGSVTVTATMAGDDDYSDVSSEPTVVTIAKGTPRVTPTYTAVTAAGSTLADVNLSFNASATVPAGTIAWRDSLTTAVQPNVGYQWVFTPDAAGSVNYTEASGVIVLWHYTPPAVSDSDSGSSSGDDSISTSGGSTTARPATTASDGTVTATVSEDLGKQLVAQAVRTGSGMVTIAPEIKRGVTDVKVEIPVSTLESLGDDTDADLKVSTPVANVTIPNGALSGLASSGTVTVSTSKSGSTVSVGISANGSAVSRVNGGLTVEVPATYPSSGTVAMLVSPNGSATVIRKSLVSSNGSAVIVPLDGSAQIRITDNSKTFGDVPSGNWASGAVAFISSHEIMNGTGTGTFSPSEPMTRGMLAAVLHNIESNPRASSSVSFPDMGSTWYTQAVQWAAGEGIVSGYSDGSFGPNDMVTREQLAVMLYRYAGQPAPSGYSRAFIDSDQVSSWAGDAIRWAVSAGILSGNEGRLNPGGQATRAEAASMLMRFMLSTGR